MSKSDTTPASLPAVVDRTQRSERITQAVSAGIIGAGSAFLGAVNPALGVLAGGLAPFVHRKINELVTRRITILRQHLDENGLDLEHLDESSFTLTDDKILLIQEAISAALGTDRDEKIAVIVRLLKIGLEAGVETDVLAARRFARTVARLDEVELRVILALHAMKTDASQKPSLQGVTARSNLGNPDLVRSALSSLESEGLVRLLPGAIETWSISDFGHRLLTELTQVFGAGS
jgi:hypothetical protein